MAGGTFLDTRNEEEQADLWVARKGELVGFELTATSESVMVALMLRQTNTRVPALAFATLLLGLAMPALADAPPSGRERPSRTLEPHHAPAMAPPAETPPPKPPPADSPALAPQTPPSAEPPPVAAPPQAQPAASEDKASNCSIDADSDPSMLGLAAMIMLIAGIASPRRRDANPARDLD